MLFSEFTSIDVVLGQYPLRIDLEEFLPDLSLDLSDEFLSGLDFALKQYLDYQSEMYFRESMIFPFLLQAWKRHPALQLWSSRGLKYDDNLYGEPDYFVAASMRGKVTDSLVNKPMLAIAEAKRQDFTAGWGQCLAELVACQKINGNEELILYGIVSTGTIWQFGKLQGKIFTRDTRDFTTSAPKQLFGILDYIFNECENQL